MRRAWLAGGLLLCGAAHAHPLAPALLELRETAPHVYEAAWRISPVRAQRGDVAPVLPADCAAGPHRVETAKQSVALHWTARCAESLTGREIAVSGLAGSGINAIVRFMPLGGAPATALLDAASPRYRATAAAPPPVFVPYMALGVEHLLLGFDHLLFVAGLVLLLAARWRALVLTVTAFTIGHSVTLALAALGIVNADARLMELGIALSILVLAVELTRSAPSLFRRHPAAIAGAFGLLHGLGFAGALAEVGLPQGEIPLALFAFNVGIEAGQLAVIAGLLTLAAVARRATRPGPAWARAVPVYFIGTLAAYWCFERAAQLI